MVHSVLILNVDRVYAECIRELARRVLPAARFEIAASVDAAAGVLAARPADLLITGIGAPIDGDVLDLLSSHQRAPQASRRVLVMTARCDYRELATLRTLGIAGVFDSATETTEQLAFAIKAVASDARYWSPSILQLLQKTGQSMNPLARVLTTFEQLALAIIGDGSDDVSAAHQLGVRPSTVSTVRRDIHRKLGVQHRGELVRIAAQHGFVRFTPEGVVRPGYALLAAAYRARKLHRANATTVRPEAERAATLIAAL